MSILDELADYARQRVHLNKQAFSEQDIKARALALPKGSFEFEQALSKGGISFICECKKASPSKGIIAQEFDCVGIAKEYEKAGADCISVLTEPKWFLGSDEYLKQTAKAVSVPCLRKDFTVDEYMIYEAKLLGAKAVLLICSILQSDDIRRYIGICDTLGISALVETHDRDEIACAVDCGARIIGVNNRDLKDFSVDISNSARLRELVPNDVLFVAESGIKTPQDVEALRQAGETLMRAADKKAMLAQLRGEEE